MPSTRLCSLQENLHQLSPMFHASFVQIFNCPGIELVWYTNCIGANFELCKLLQTDSGRLRPFEVGGIIHGPSRSCGFRWRSNACRRLSLLWCGHVNAHDLHRAIGINNFSQVFVVLLRSNVLDRPRLCECGLEIHTNFVPLLL